MQSTRSLIDQRIAALRQMMQEAKLDAYIIPSSDPHQSEYVADHWKGREWISGFSGSAGIVVVTLDHAGLWTDSRYFLQAEEELADSEVVLHKQGIPHAPEHIGWLAAQLSEGSKVGLDGLLFSVGQVRRLARAFDAKNIEIDSSHDLIGPIWKKQPAIPLAPVVEHDVKYAGLSRSEKLSKLRDHMATAKVNYAFLSTLDDIAWLFNLRGTDVECNPVFIAYAVVGKEITYLFVDAQKVEESLKSDLRNDGILLKPYEAIEAYLQQLEADIL
ncbi:MAG: aminopeptidase P family N-terminal domain-containing protein, partial [Bacteroidota bacterium]